MEGFSLPHGMRVALVLTSSHAVALFFSSDMMMMMSPLSKLGVSVQGFLIQNVDHVEMIVLGNGPCITMTTASVGMI